MKQDHRSILISLPNDLIEKADQCAQELQLSRTKLITRSLERDIAYILEHEAEIASGHQQELTKRYCAWAAAQKG